MRKSILLIAVAILGSLLAHFFLQDPGYVLINSRGGKMETTIPGLIMLLVLGYLVLRLLIRVFRAPRQFGQAVSNQRQNRARRKLNRGLIEIAEGNWKQGETLLAQGARSGDMPLLNYLNAARAAQLQGEHERRDNWLMLAYEQDKDASTAVLLTQAELQISHQQYEEALATLRKVEDNDPGHTHAQVLLATVYEQLKDWESLCTLAPKLRKIKKTPLLKDVTRLLLIADRHRLSTAGIAKDKTGVTRYWQSFSAATRKQPHMVLSYAQALVDCDDHAAAEKAVSKALGTTWDDDLAQFYGSIKGSAAKKQLDRAEGWLKTRGDHGGLLVTCAKLAMRCELWGKARSYLEAALAIQPRAETYQIYGELLTQLGETDHASAAFRHGLAILTGGTSLTPALTGPDAPNPSGKATSTS